MREAGLPHKKDRYVWTKITRARCERIGRSLGNQASNRAQIYKEHVNLRHQEIPGKRRAENRVRRLPTRLFEWDLASTHRDTDLQEVTDADRSIVCSLPIPKDFRGWDHPAQDRHARNQRTGILAAFKEVLDHYRGLFDASLRVLGSANRTRPWFVEADWSGPEMSDGKQTAGARVGHHPKTGFEHPHEGVPDAEQLLLLSAQRPRDQRGHHVYRPHFDPEEDPQRKYLLGVAAGGSATRAQSSPHRLTWGRATWSDYSAQHGGLQRIRLIEGRVYKQEGRRGYAWHLRQAPRRLFKEITFHKRIAHLKQRKHSYGHTPFWPCNADAADS